MDSYCLLYYMCSLPQHLYSFVNVLGRGFVLFSSCYCDLWPCPCCHGLGLADLWPDPGLGSVALDLALTVLALLTYLLKHCC